jgi:UDP-N-acetylmuramyl pentapeptide phosphotransferase/UDP-N-acetylglucosamine-1-phosphate transferase
VVSAVWGAFFAAVLVGYLIVRYPGLLARVGADHPDSGPQKFHDVPTPRIGGLAVFAGLGVATITLGTQGDAAAVLLLIALLCGAGAFGVGLVEDCTRKVRVQFRLILTFVSAALGFVFLDARVTELHLPGADWLLSFSVASFLFTVFAVAGLAHATNIIDGFNGLAGVVAILFLVVIAAVAAQVGDQPVMTASLVLIAAIAGFLVFNFPLGRIFLGDGGAYLVGFLVAELAVLLVHRNSEVSPWFALTLFAYPVVETVFSMYRKRLLQGTSPGDPDGLHLHMLVHKRLVRRPGRLTGVASNWRTSPYLWALASAGCIPALLFWRDTTVLQLALGSFVVLYLWGYRAIVRFRTPRALRWPLHASSISSGREFDASLADSAAHGNQHNK